MAARLTAYFTQAKAMGGVPGVVKLAMISRISSVKAGELPDTPENVAALEGAMAELRKQLGK